MDGEDMIADMCQPALSSYTLHREKIDSTRKFDCTKYTISSRYLLILLMFQDISKKYTVCETDHLTLCRQLAKIG
jgi:hypothetical protein